jgi:hypothetical protein
MPPAANKPIDKKHNIADNKQRQDIDQHRPSSITSRLDITSEQAEKGKARHQEGRNQKDKRKILVDS